MIDGELDRTSIDGVPATTQYGDSGMYDIVLDPDYQDNGWIYMGYVHALGDPSVRETPAMTRVIRGRVEGHQWVDQETIFRVPVDQLPRFSTECPTHSDQRFQPSLQTCRYSKSPWGVTYCCGSE